MKINKIIGLIFLCLYSLHLQAENEYWITVIVHGSFSLRPHLSIKNSIYMLEDMIEDTIYYRSTEICRRDPFFFKNQAMLELGFKKVDKEHPNKEEAARLLANLCEQVAQEAGTHPCQEYYTYGWSGLVSHKLRYLEAGLLYKKLQSKVHELKKAGHNPKVRVIAYSHGGNLSLQLGAVHVTKSAEEQFTINELFLFGTPVQTETDYLINSPVFEKVYNIYSGGDQIQKLDFFSYKRFFSQRRFERRKNFEIPEKLTQIRLRMNEYVPYSAQEGVGPIPQDDKTLMHNYRELSFDPGHFELWFMGWTILTYRSDFPLNPLPIFIFIPYITKYLDSIEGLSKDVVVQMRPCNESIAIYNYNQPRTRRDKHKTIMPFMKQEKLSALKKEALLYEPLDYNLDMYNRKMYNSIDVARHEYNELQSLKFKERKYNKINNKRPTRDNLTPDTKTVSLHSRKDKKHLQTHLHP